MGNAQNAYYCGFISVPMNIEEIREYCISKPAVTEGFPFNDTALVFKVAGKMFALLDRIIFTFPGPNYAGYDISSVFPGVMTGPCEVRGLASK